MDKLRFSLSAVLSGYGSQVDKSGAPYIQHLMRVAGSVDEDYLCVALLHDYFEDVYQLNSVAEMTKVFPFLDKEEILALYFLTRQVGIETYAEYIHRLAGSKSRAALQVKLADIDDHLSRPTFLSDSLHRRYIDARYVIIGAYNGEDVQRLATAVR
jgi:hypothetical protein